LKEEKCLPMKKIEDVVVIVENTIQSAT